MKPTIFLESHNLKNRYSGFGQFNYNLINALARQDFSDLDLVLHAKDVNALKTEFGSRFQYKKYTSLSRHKWLRIKKKYDLWHCLNQNIKIEPFYHLPYLLTVHDVHFITEGDEDKQVREKERFENKLNRSSAITYISKFTKADTHKHFKVPNVPEYVIYNGNPVNTVSIPENFSASVPLKRPFLYSIGDFSERKNFISLVEMMPYMKEYSLILSGNMDSSYAQRLIDRVRELHLEDRIFLTGKISETEKQFYLKNCQAFVFPSLREGFGIPPIEAMRFGKPVILSNNTSLPEIGGAFAAYWDNYQPKNMAELVHKQIDRTYSDLSYVREIKNHALSFSWENAAKSYLAVYRELISSN